MRRGKNIKFTDLLVNYIGTAVLIHFLRFFYVRGFALYRNNLVGSALILKLDALYIYGLTISCTQENNNDPVDLNIFLVFVHFTNKVA